MSVSPPPGISIDECGVAQMMVSITDFSGAEIHMFTAFFQPTKEELEQLNNGAYFAMNMIGHVVPHNAWIQPNG